MTLAAADASVEGLPEPEGKGGMCVVSLSSPSVASASPSPMRSIAEENEHDDEPGQGCS